VSTRRYRQASGPSFLDSAALGYLDGGRSAVVLVRATPQAPTPVELGVRCLVPTLLTGLWRAPDGAVFTADRDGFVRWSADPWGDQGWQQQELDLVFHGVHGHTSRHVWAWGVRPHDGASLLRRFDGRTWKAVGAPGFAVAAMSVGAQVWCAGEGGQLARFDGSGWTVLQMADGADLVALHGPDDAPGVLVAAADGRIVHCGDPDPAAPGAGAPPVRVLGQLPVRPHAVAWWRGEVWVGAGEQGLWCLRDGEPTCVRADRRCRSIDARSELVLGCDDVISGSPDGVRFPATGRGFLDGR
jgi:hypothetical protein